MRPARRLHPRLGMESSAFICVHLRLQFLLLPPEARIPMSASTAFEPIARMSREEYRAWAEQQPSGRFERVNGVVVAMAPEPAQGTRLAGTAPSRAGRRAALRGLHRRHDGRGGG